MRAPLRLSSSPTAWLVLTFIATRVGLAMLLLVDDEVVGANDIWRYHAVAHEVWSSSKGVDAWEYPVGSFLVTLPPLLLGGDQQLAYFLRFFAVALVFDAITLAALLRVAPRGSRNITGAWVWVLALPTLGLISLTRLDVASCAFAALALATATATSRFGVSSFLATLGASIKVWPALISLAVLEHSREKTRWLLGTLAALGLLVALAQALDVWSLSTSFLEYQRDRGLHVESIAALPLLWLDRLEWADYRVSFEFGAQQIDGPGTGTLALALSALMLVLLLGLGFLSRSRRFIEMRRPDRVVVTTMLGVCVLILINKVFSGQYLLWLILAMSAYYGYRPLDRRAIGALLAACGITHLVFPYMYRDLVSGGLTPLILLTLRDLVLVYVVWRLSAPYLVRRDALDVAGGVAPRETETVSP